MLLALVASCLSAAGCGSGSSDKATTVDLALRGQKAKRQALEGELARERRRARRAAKARAAKVGVPEAAAGTLLTPGATQSFESLAASTPGQLGVAVAPLGGPERIAVFGSLRAGHAWSTIKVPILVALMREGALSSQERQAAAAALEASDNEAAASLFDRLERAHGGLAGASAAVQETLAAAGDSGTAVATAPPPPGAFSTYGQTEWSLEGSTAFFRSLARGCLLSPAGTEYVLDLMRGVIPEQRWGLGEGGFDQSWTVAMKGGWGPEASGGYLVRQSGVVQGGSAGVVVAMIVADDSLAAGAADLTRIATWLRESLRGLGAPARGC